MTFVLACSQSTFAITGNLESPSLDSVESGVGLIRGWVCDSNEVVVTIDDGPPLSAGYGTPRGDTIGICRDINNGFGITFNWGNLSSGSHSIRAYSDGDEFAHVEFSVAPGLNSSYLSNASATSEVLDFPNPGDKANIYWNEKGQNFGIYNIEYLDNTSRIDKLSVIEGEDSEWVGQWIRVGSTDEFSAWQRTLNGVVITSTISLVHENNKGHPYIGRKVDAIFLWKQ